MSDDNYVCTLNEACLKQAKEELNEDPKERLGAVQTLREWIEQQPHLICRTDTPFLLKFLRTAKYSQLRAREVLEGYLGLKTKNPQWYTSWDPTDKLVQRFLKAGLYSVLPGYYKNGAKIIVYRMCQLKQAFDNFKKVTAKDKDAMAKADMLTIMHLLRDENVQVSGLYYMIDMTDCPMKVLTLFSMAESKEMMDFQDKVPGRYKGFWYYNEAAIIDAMLALFKPFMKKKMVSRMRFFGSNLENLYKEVPMHMLPDEWLPDDYTGPRSGTFDQLAQKFYEEVTTEEAIADAKLESDPKWRIDKSKKPTDVPVASFRKLNVE